MREITNRITLDPEICHGKPTVRGSRLMVATVLELMASDMTVDEILADYPALKMADIKACLQDAVNPYSQIKQTTSC